jgi:hypothetical protein
MDVADRYFKDAEKCERLATVCAAEISRSFFLDAAAHWRQMALEAEYAEPPSSLVPTSQEAQWRRVKSRLKPNRLGGCDVLYP